MGAARKRPARYLLAAIDPGVRYAALAHFLITENRSTLVDVARPEGASPLGTGKACAAATLALADGWPVVVVAERPQAYRDRQVTHGSVENLNATLNAYRDALQPYAWESYTPNEWKGQIPKKPHHARVCAAAVEIGGTLLGERAGASGGPGAGWARLSHDERDAVALGLYGCGKVGRGGAALSGTGSAPAGAERLLGAPPQGSLFSPEK